MNNVLKLFAQDVKKPVVKRLHNGLFITPETTKPRSALADRGFGIQS
jgi:hypothetical protein